MKVYHIYNYKYNYNYREAKSLQDTNGNKFV